MIYLQLFWSFCKIGFTSFGGISMVPLINSEMLAHGWMTTTEVADIVAIAEMTPGPLGLNCATFAGMRVAGIIGAIVANSGIIAPTFTICAAAAYFFEKWKKSPVFGNVLLGVRPVSIGLVSAVVIGMLRENYYYNGAFDFVSIAILAISAYLLIKKKMSIPKVIGISALIGIIFCR